jgi:predicted nucleotidyltransferase
MIPKNTSKIIKFLLRNTEKTNCNINQIAKSIKISVGSSFKILKELEKTKIVTSQAIGNAAYYVLNLDNLEAVKLCELLLLEEKRHLTGYAKLYSESIQYFDKAELIILFGSVLTKKEFNDVDVLFVTNKVKEVNAFCLEVSKIRTKPVVPLILKKADLIKELKERKEVIVSIIKEGIVLKGESILVEVIKNAKN